MKNFLVLAVATATLTIASPVLASGDDVNCGDMSGPHLNQDEIKARAVEMGYDVRKVKTEGNCFEVYAIDQNGAKVELYMSPVTGEIVRPENKS